MTFHSSYLTHFCLKRRLIVKPIKLGLKCVCVCVSVIKVGACVLELRTDLYLKHAIRILSADLSLKSLPRLHLSPLSNTFLVNDLSPSLPHLAKYNSTSNHTLPASPTTVSRENVSTCSFFKSFSFMRRCLYQTF